MDEGYNDEFGGYIDPKDGTASSVSVDLSKEMRERLKDKFARVRAQHKKMPPVPKGTGENDADDGYDDLGL